MKTYIYPSDMKAKASLWLWTLRDFLIMIVAAILSLLALVNLHTTFVLAMTIAYAIATARIEGQCIADHIIVAARYFIIVPQTYFWRMQK